MKPCQARLISSRRWCRLERLAQVLLRVNAAIFTAAVSTFGRARTKHSSAFSALSAKRMFSISTRATLLPWKNSMSLESALSMPSRAMRMPRQMCHAGVMMCAIWFNALGANTWRLLTITPGSLRKTSSILLGTQWWKSTLKRIVIKTSASSIFERSTNRSLI